MDYPERYKIPEYDLQTTRQDLAKRYAEYFRRGYSINPEAEESSAYAHDFTADMREYMYAEQQSPDNSSEHIKSRVLAAYNQANPYKEPVTTLSKAVDSYGLNFRILHNLSSIDMINLLYATAYAGMSRHTKAGTKLSNDAYRAITHEMTNTWMRHEIESEIEEKDEERNFDRIVRSGYAGYAMAKLDIFMAINLPDEAPVVSIDAVLPVISQPRFLLTDQPSLEDELRIAAGLEVLHLYEDPNDPIKTIPMDKIQQRLTDISILETDLRNKFGQDITIQYKELTLSLDRSTRDLYQPLERQTNHQDKNEPSEGSSDFSEYTFIEISKPSGEIYIIADSPDHSNACYIIRGDVLKEMSVVFDKDITWQDLLRYPKETARQLGATRFYHTDKTDTLGKAVSHIERPVETILKTIGHTWLLSKNPIFNKDMQPTPSNRLPLAMRQLIADRAVEARDLLLSWLGLDDISALHTESQIAHRAVNQYFEDLRVKTSELEQARAELLQKDTEISQLKADNAKLARMLRGILDDIEPQI